jgi:hypothetical protein
MAACGFNSNPCPIGTGVGGSCSGAVHPTVNIQGNGYVYIGHDPALGNLMAGTGNPTGGTYAWSSPDTSISFDNAAAADVHITATSYSGGINDTKITLNYSYNSQSATPASVMVTKRLIYYLAGDSMILYSSFNGPSTYGYIYYRYYNIFTHPDKNQITDGSGAATYENVTNISHNVPFTPTYGQGAVNASNQVQDTIQLTSSKPFPASLSIVDSQDLGVAGFYVRNNTITYAASGVTVQNNGNFP